ncbi:putative addiction module toxin (plasmid) [Candidatus Protochlamydia naegleriophila]|uniref:Putative addiction module toxin n=1 Tax=Candidatus Protochlamydia naegleriophila TaxID=389348 RepID=A0A0U5EUX3_9BACT|nr:putative addiction module toxin [Candidatus Protochlamydia naegleriophila]
MKRYKLKFDCDLKKILSKIPKYDGVLLRKRMTLLEEDPRPNGALKLKGQDNSYRIRCGKYRIIYEIKDNELIVLIIDVDSRKDVYKGL